MTVFRRLLPAALLLPIALSACRGTEAPSLQTIGAPQSAAIAFVMMRHLGPRDPATARPAAILGVYIANFLTGGPGTYNAAIKGAQLQAGFQTPPPTTEEVYLVLQQLGATLQVDVPDLLNRSTTRRTALDSYLKTLQDAIVAAGRQVQTLETRGEQLDDTQNAQRKKANAIQRDLNAALRDKDYATAANKQKELQPAESDLRATELQQEEVENLIDMYDDLQELAAQRLDAITKNREVLIAGTKVIDVPGIDDLGVLERSRRRNLGL